jgi:hypothetical protein
MVSAASVTIGKTMTIRLAGNREDTNIPTHAAARLLVFRQRFGPSKVNRKLRALQNPRSPTARIPRTTAGES